MSWLARIVPFAGDRDEGVRGRSSWNRVLTVSALSMLALFVLLGVVFSVSYGSRRITTNATALHKTDEMLRTSMVAKAQLDLAVNLAVVDREQGSNSITAIDFSIKEAEEALAEMRTGFFGDLVDQTTGIAEDFPHTIDVLEDDIQAFGSASARVVARLEDNDAPGAQALANGELTSTYEALQDSLRSERDDFRTDIEASSEFLETLGSITRFLVAFLIPAAVILLYRTLIRRQQRQTELETRLQAEREIGHAREEFIANASHELRTPLTGIHGLAMLLEEEPTVNESEMATELIGLIVSESADLGRMVEDLLTTARLDAGALHYTFEDVEVLAEVNEVVEPMRRAGMTIGVECEKGMVRADRLRFRQVLRNLLSNARKYGGPNVRVHGKLESNAFVCAVVDDGEGIPDELEARLFQRFIHQGHQTAVRESVGLGLSIVRSLIEGMGGNVYYERNKGETAFVIVLPLATGAPAETQLATRPRPAEVSANAGVEVAVGWDLATVVD